MQKSTARGSQAAVARGTTTTILPSVGLGVGAGRLPTVQHPSAHRQRQMGQITGLSVMKQTGLEILGKPVVAPAVTKTAVPAADAATGLTPSGKELRRDGRRQKRHDTKVSFLDGRLPPADAFGRTSLSVCMCVSNALAVESKDLERIQGDFVYQGHRVKFKVTGAKLRSR